MSDTPYSARVRNVELLERAASQTTELYVYRDGVAVTVTSAKYTLINPNGKKITDDAAAVIAPSKAITYTHAASDIPSTELLGEGYIQEFKAIISGSEYIFRRMAAVVLRRLYPVISDTDLTAVYTDLESLRPSSITSYQKYIDDAWYQILRKIRTRGKGYEYLVMTPESFYEAHRHLALYLIFRDFHSSLAQTSGRYLDLAQEHHRAYMQEFDSINFVYDSNHDNKPEEPDVREAAQPVIYLNMPPYGAYRKRWY